MLKAKMVSKHQRGTVENQMQLRAGEQGAGKVIARVNYWPNSPGSISAARDLLCNAAERDGYTVVYDSED